MTNDLGKKGELISAEHLISNGYTILERNWRFGHLEIDLIAKKKDLLVFIEVKTRRSEHLQPPEQAVNQIKTLRLITAAEHYIDVVNWSGPIRFDIISIIVRPLSQELCHWKDAFIPGVL